MAALDKITVSGTLYDIQDTTARQGLSGKQDTLVSGENIKTINNSSILGEGNLEINVDVDPTLDSGSTNAVANSAITAALSGKADVSSTTNYFDAAVYDSGTTRINFYHGGSTTGTIISWIDASDFIKDGMVDSVTITGGNLVITFNTDAGKQDITIALTDIFDPNDYYNTAQTYSKTEIDAALSAKADTATTYTKTEVDAALSGKADTATTYTKTEVDTALSGKQDTLVSGTNIKTIDGTTLLGSGNIATTQVWKGTQQEYEAIETKTNNTIYFIIAS